MAFNVRGFLRQLPAERVKDYFESRNMPVPAKWWSEKGLKLATRLADHLLTRDDHACGSILAELARAHVMADERGRTALINASLNRSEITEAFAKLENDADRAVWMLTSHKNLFQEAEELLFFDYYSERKQGRHYLTDPNLEVSREDTAVSDFKNSLCKFYRRRDGSGVSCEVEFVERRQDNGLQATIYVQGLPSNATEFAEGKFVRRVSRPAVEAAVVYEPATGETSTVAKGGKEVHEELRDLFARHLLKIDPKFSPVRRRRFLLNSLRSPRSLPADPSAGVKTVRVRKLRLAPPGLEGGFMAIEAPSGAASSVYDAANAWFAEQAGVFRKFAVVHTTIAMQFDVVPGRKRSRTINIELTRPNSSNLKNLPEADRKIAEAHIERWGLIETPGS